MSVKWGEDGVDYGDEIPLILLIIASIVAIFGGSIAFFCNIFTLIKCLTFPELAILEYVKTFMQ